jgi:hypothetical protein
MSVIKTGIVGWSLQRDEEGNRTYALKSQVVTNDINDGPFVVMNASGLPTVGSLWSFGNDFDVWAFCTAGMKVTPRITKEPNRVWDIEQDFTTKTVRKRCGDTEIEDPLQEPDRIGGSFVRYTEEATRDRNGDPIVTSALQQIRGAQVEFDSNRPTVTISQNSSTLGLETFTSMIDTVNDATLWGLESRRIKLSNVTWERALVGVCDFYYIKTYEFDINFNTFDRVIQDWGTMARGEWWDDEGTPMWDDTTASAVELTVSRANMKRYKDIHGELADTVLDGTGLPASTSTVTIGKVSGGNTGPPATRTVEKYAESNFLLLGIPTVLT